jgi:hypothetical protein
MCQKIRFGARRADSGRDDLTGSDLEVRDQRLGPVAVVFKFPGILV